MVSTSSGESPRTAGWTTTAWASKGCERGRGSSGRKRGKGLDHIYRERAPGEGRETAAEASWLPLMAFINGERE
jgi:hypothetical protein